MAKGCSPNGVVKKQSLYSRHPRACSGWGRGGREGGREGRVRHHKPNVDHPMLQY